MSVCVEKGRADVSPVGFGGATVKISPPLVITEAALLEERLPFWKKPLAKQRGIARRRLDDRMNVSIVGGGMITHDQILPSLYQMQRLGAVGEIRVCAQHGRTLRALAASETMRAAFPEAALSRLSGVERRTRPRHPKLYREVDGSHAAAAIVVVVACRINSITKS